MGTHDLAGYCPDLATWAQSWCGEDRDVIPGEAIVAVFQKFDTFLQKFHIPHPGLLMNSSTYNDL